MLSWYSRKSEVLRHRRETEGTGEQTVKRLSLLVRKCVDDMVVSTHYDITVVRIEHNSFWFPMISVKLTTCANSVFQPLSFPTHQEPSWGCTTCVFSKTCIPCLRCVLLPSSGTKHCCTIKHRYTNFWSYLDFHKMRDVPGFRSVGHIYCCFILQSYWSVAMK